MAEVRNVIEELADKENMLEHWGRAKGMENIRGKGKKKRSDPESQTFRNRGKTMKGQNLSQGVKRQ